MRKEVPEIGWGDFRVIAKRDPAILTVRYDWRNNSVLFVHNLDQEPCEASFSVGLSDDEGEHLINLLSEGHSEANDLGKHTLMLEAYGYRWYRVGGLDYLLKPTDIDGVNVNSPAVLFLIARCSPRRHPDKAISRA